MTLVLNPKEVIEIKSNLSIQKFHFSFFKEEEDIYSTGVNIEKSNLIDAYLEFKKQFPGKEPFCVHNKSLINK
jgi:uncharacterized protein YktA (UPF0223 family)